LEQEVPNLGPGNCGWQGAEAHPYQFSEWMPVSSQAHPTSYMNNKCKSEQAAHPMAWDSQSREDSWPTRFRNVATGDQLNEDLATVHADSRSHRVDKTPHMASSGTAQSPPASRCV